MLQRIEGENLWFVKAGKQPPLLCKVGFRTRIDVGKNVTSRPLSRAKSDARIFFGAFDHELCIQSLEIIVDSKPSVGDASSKSSLATPCTMNS